MASPKKEYEETVFYQQVTLHYKQSWVEYFKLLYNEREHEQERLTAELRDRLLKSCGLPLNRDTMDCLEGLNLEWIKLLNGFFRHYHSMLYTEYCMVMKHLDELVEAQFREAKDQKEIQAKTTNLQMIKPIRLMAEELRKELYNRRHGNLANIVHHGVLFKDGVVENEAKKRSSNPKNPRQRATETEYE